MSCLIHQPVCLIWRSACLRFDHIWLAALLQHFFTVFIFFVPLLGCPLTPAEATAPHPPLSLNFDSGSDSRSWLVRTIRPECFQAESLPEYVSTADISHFLEPHWILVLSSCFIQPKCFNELWTLRLDKDNPFDQEKTRLRKTCASSRCRRYWKYRKSVKNGRTH